MGVLEEAIREHLELKRRHGASDEEVEQKELEALGPARREFEEAAEETSDEGEVAVAEPEAEAAVPEEQPGPEPAPDQPPAPDEPIAEPAATRLHESPAPETRLHESQPDEPPLPEADRADFAEAEEDPPWQSPPRDWDFD
jgi:hypothetical protein